MKIDNIQKSDVQVIGDIQQIKASIDVENIEFITTLLSSNLYSNPEESFLREIVSNAWDSHVEAGNTEEPVIIKLEEDAVIIRDYGTGLSKKDFENLYCKIGSSTKRDSNAYIGAFGLGHLSPLAVSNIVYITSIYNGIKRDYIMIKENGNITTNYLGDSKTTEHNGLQIKVNLPMHKITYITRDIISKLVFFPNIYVDYGSISCNPALNFNKAKVKRYKNFSVSDILSVSPINSYYDTRKEGVWVLLGNVLYPLDLSKLNPIDLDTKENLNRCNICLNVNIGDINVTPNRESIIYSEKTINILNDKLADALIEIQELIKNKSSVNTNSLKEYYNYISKRAYWHPLNDTIDNIREDWECSITASYKGSIKDNDFNNALTSIYKSTIPGFKNIYRRDTLHTIKRIPYSIRENCKICSDKFLVIEDNRNITGYVKKYIIENTNYHSVPIIQNMTREDIKSKLYSLLGRWTLSAAPIGIEEAVEEMTTWIIDHIQIITTKEINEYKDAIKASLPKDKRVVDNTLYAIHEFTFDLYSYYCETKQSQIKIDKVISYLKRDVGKALLHNGKEITSEQVNIYRALQFLGYKIIWVNNKLYCSLVKYKVVNPTKLINIHLDYQAIFNNLSSKEECMLVIGKHVALGSDPNHANSYLYFDYFSKAMRDTVYFNALRDHYNLSKRGNKNYNWLYYSSILKHYTFKSPNAIWMDKFLYSYERFTKVAIEYYNKFHEHFTLITTAATMATYKACKDFIRDKKYINIQEYIKLKNDPLIKMIYE